ncbi:Hypothetical protein DEACI_0206 [Acididesulfobacillus acetoxydans]|uniref:Uncharacterized protein n=1 Tax=Acididesulfobacillus acetoxydans TaxID=1561005 RepID=A0A8S0X2X8_9FIRM|nr:Hypothetical protein DEACI_0206 [Acididesulfobacillus acetoxydans]CEJ07775.1 Hypothetical protein DEACI_2241 [Acididesulfobacillus acetoxydans]
MSDQRVSINFCGGCNPWINRQEIAQEVKRLLSQDGCVVVFNSYEADLVIYLSGCSSNCAQKFSSEVIPCVVVAAASIDAAAVEEQKIAAEIVARVRRFCKRMEVSMGSGHGSNRADNFSRR